ncbi:purine-cytosine permease family protein [Alicyclobacillus dauci]|uniref:Cytosine permease n=1 Tax=Alicyclobacillus dauci TaxID=1475485 RepID=A0ABY6Z220_9BACL|nr:cytosine permease [Alicyclobacillus dauci]WAH36558.1 cytosine permease [Alicyclobacillus dauci]
MIKQPETVVYGERVLKVEPFSVERVPDRERHGNAFGQFTLWLGSNLTIADYALGFIPVSLGMSWTWAIISIIIGNLLGAVVLALCAAMGPAYGLPQLIITRGMFGRVGGYIPGLLNFISTIGWFTVNNILGSFGLHAMFPGLPVAAASVILVAVQGVVATLGHNFIHAYERAMSVILGIVFAIVTVLSLGHWSALAGYHASTNHVGLAVMVMVGATFSYLGSWGPYASDYSRYLQASVSKVKVGFLAAIGAFIASAWLEIVGMFVAVLAAGHSTNSIDALHDTMGGFGTIATIAIILGGTAADAINLYSNSLSARALDIRIPRWALVIVASLIGLVLSLVGQGQFESNFENFLLLIGYWITPWMGVLFADFYIRGKSRDKIIEEKSIQSVGLLSFVIGIAVSVPFMDNAIYVGPIAKAWSGLDLAFYVGFAVSFVLYLVLKRTDNTRIRRAA